MVKAYRNGGTQQGLHDAGKGNTLGLYLSRGDMALQTVAAATMFSGPIAAALEGRLARTVAQCLEEGLCFTAGTKVAVKKVDTAKSVSKQGKNKTTPSTLSVSSIAYVSIENVKKGDTVVSRDEATGKTVSHKVTGTSVLTSAHLISVALADAKSGKIVETLQATRNHPFFVDGKGWVPAGGLAIGNSIVTRAGPKLVVKSIKW